MRKLIWLALLTACFAQSTEVKRPTADVDGGSATGIGCTGSNVGSAAMPKAWDALGIPTFNLQETTGNKTTIRFQTRIFKSWTGAANTYSNLALKVNARSNGWRDDGELNGNACIAYSVNSGASWTSIKCDGTSPSTGGNGWTQQTFEVILDATQDLTTVQVGICTQGNKQIMESFGTDDISLFDIWTEGSIGPPPAGSGSTAGVPHRTGVVVN